MLSTLQKKIPHFWINEGIATFLAGSSEKSFDWHLNELKEFHKTNPKYNYANIKNLTDFDIPNGKHMTDLRYIVGAILIREIYKLEGIKGIKNSLTIGNKDEDLYLFLKEKLNISENDFNKFIQKQLVK